MRVKASSLKSGDKFLYPDTARPLESPHQRLEPCLVLKYGDNGNQVEFVVIRSGLKGFLPLAHDVSKCEGFKVYWDKRLT